MEFQDNNNGNNFNHDRNRHGNRDGGFRGGNDGHRRFDNRGGQGGFNPNGGQRFERQDVTFKDKTDDQIVQILLDKQKKIGRNLFGSDIHPLYELIIRQNKRIKALEEKTKTQSSDEINQ